MAPALPPSAVGGLLLLLGSAWWRQGWGGCGRSSLPGGGHRHWLAWTMARALWCPGFGDRFGFGFEGRAGFASLLFMLVRGHFGAGFDGGSG